MFQRVFLGPLDKDENRRLRDVNRRELFIFLAFLLFIFWIGIYPQPYFNLMDTSVGDLVNSLSSAVVAVP